MLNDIDFDYPDLGLPNLVWAKSKAGTYTKPVKLAPTIAPIAYEAAKKFPKWKFVGNANWSFDDRLEVSKLAVYENREKIGTINVATTRNGVKFILDCERIRGSRKRGSTAQTGDTKKALKIMAKSFGGKTIAEKVEDTCNKLRNGINNGCAARMGVYNSGMSSLVRHLSRYIFDNFESVSAAAIAAGADAATINVLPGIRDSYATTSDIKAALDKNNGNFVMLDGSNYLVCDGAETAPLVLTSDTVPSDLKGKIGMLKLIENNHFLKGVGYRLDANAFYIIRGE